MVKRLKIVETPASSKHMVGASNNTNSKNTFINHLIFTKCELTSFVYKNRGKLHKIRALSVMLYYPNTDGSAI